MEPIGEGGAVVGQSSEPYEVVRDGRIIEVVVLEKSEVCVRTKRKMVQERRRDQKETEVGARARDPGDPVSGVGREHAVDRPLHWRLRRRTNGSAKSPVHRLFQLVALILPAPGRFGLSTDPYVAGLARA